MGWEAPERASAAAHGRRLLIMRGGWLPVKKGVSTGRKVCFVVFLLFITVVLASISTAIGSADLSLWDIYLAILHRFFQDHFESRWIAEVVVWNLRLPRSLPGIGAGVALGLAGGMMQWALRNPLATPYTLGISSAAVFGTPLGLILIFGRGFHRIEFFVIGAVLALTLIATFIILNVSRRRWATPERVALVGIALTIFFSTMTIVVPVVLAGGGFEILAARLPKIFTAGNMTVAVTMLIATSVILAIFRRRLVTLERIVLAGVALM
ncbi:MAG: iron chelate uptake ABC transporter family permease subunit, partial [Euryarchaeota archaeon]|nr:iron chelate uptake ABC transporter family permease subunit [Euryarchaeota archaeon]